MVSRKPWWAPDHQHLSRGHLQGQMQMKSVLHPLHEHNHLLKALYATQFGVPQPAQEGAETAGLLRSKEKQRSLVIKIVPTAREDFKGMNIRH